MCCVLFGVWLLLLCVLFVVGCLLRRCVRLLFLAVGCIVCLLFSVCCCGLFVVSSCVLLVGC